MRLLDRSTNKRHIEKFQAILYNLLVQEIPEIREVKKKNKLRSMNFPGNPPGIALTYEILHSDYEKHRRTYNTDFTIQGVQVWYRKKKLFTDIPLYFYSYSLKLIEVAEPTKFHKVYVLSRLQITELIKNEVIQTNPDSNKLRSILAKFIPDYHSDLFDIEYSFEIDHEGTSFLTLIDLEDGYYVCLNELGEVFLAMHDALYPFKMIAHTPNEFVARYGSISKTELIKPLVN